MSLEATYRLRVGWTGRYTGYFVVGNVGGTGLSFIAPSTSPGPGYDVLGDNIAIPQYKGTYDTIQDDEYGALNFTVTRGRDDPFSNMLSGQLEVLLNDVYPGRYNPKNAASPLAGQLLPLRPCCLDCTLDGGASYVQLFNGWLDELSSDVDWKTDSVARLTFKDLYLWLDRFKNVTIPPTGQTTVGAAINLVLNAAGWPAGLRSIATGSIIPDFSVNPGTSLLEALAGILEVDMGYFFHSRDNIATYWDRYEAARKVSIGTFSSSQASQPGTALSTVRNTATATMTGGTQQYWQDDASVAQFTPNGWDDVDSPYFNSDSDALSFCQARVALGRDPASPVWTHSVQEGPAGYADLILASEFLDRVSIDAYGQVLDYSVQKIVHRGEGGQLHQTDWVLAEMPKSLPFFVADSNSLVAPASNSAGYRRIWY